MSSFAPVGVLNTFESTPASRSSNVGVQAMGPVMKRPSFAGSCACAPEAIASTARRTIDDARSEDALMLFRGDRRFDALEHAVVRIYQSSIRPARDARRVDEQLPQLAVIELLPLIDSAIAVGVLFGADRDAFVVQFMAVRNAVAARGDVDAHLVGGLDDPCVLDTIGLA